MVKFQVLLARGQVLHAEGSIGVLGGRAESLGKANWNRRGGQELCVGMSLPGGQQVSAAAWPVIDPYKAFVLRTESTTGWWKEYCTGIQETWVPVALPQPAVCSQANHLSLLGLTCFICAMGC